MNTVHTQQDQPEAGRYLYTITCCEDIRIYAGVEAACKCGCLFMATGPTPPEPLPEPGPLAGLVAAFDAEAERIRAGWAQ